MAEAAEQLAAAFLRGVLAEGLRPDPALRLLRSGAGAIDPAVAGSRIARGPSGIVESSGVASPGVASPGVELRVDDPEALGLRHEDLLDPDERVRRGAWYTPGPLARTLVERAVTSPGDVGDPTCGGGAFLLAAADRLVDCGVAPGEVVEERLWGADISPLAVAVTEASLWWWSARRGAPTRPQRLIVADTLAPGAIPGLDVVVGNPPFLGQLKRRSAADTVRRDQLQRWYPDLIGAYTDQAWLFLAAAVDAVRPGGRVCLIQPQSLLAARDARAVRTHVDRRAARLDVWVDDGTLALGDAAGFRGANVHVCAPLVERRSAASTPAPGAEPVPVEWTATLRRAQGIPDVTLGGGLTVGDRAEVLAGFRDEYYGLVDAVVEGGSGPRLVTSGAIDPLRRRPGPVRFAKATWTDPTIDVERAQPRARRWVERQLAPSVLIASQTAVLECLADPSGDVVVGVPGLAVVVSDPEDLWSVCAALQSPAVTAHLLARTVGTGLSAGALRPTAALVAAVPLPVDAEAWADGARRAALLHGAGDGATTDEWWEFALAMGRAYRVDDEVARWWAARHPVFTDDDAPGPGHSLPAS